MVAPALAFTETLSFMPAEEVCEFDGVYEVMITYRRLMLKVLTSSPTENVMELLP